MKCYTHYIRSMKLDTIYFSIHTWEWCKNKLSIILWRVVDISFATPVHTLSPLHNTFSIWNQLAAMQSCTFTERKVEMNRAKNVRAKMRINIYFSSSPLSAEAFFIKQFFLCGENRLTEYIFESNYILWRIDTSHPVLSRRCLIFIY